MSFSRQPLRIGALRHFVFAVLVLVTVAAGCNRFRGTDMTPLDNAGVWFNGVEELRSLNLNDAEVQQIVLVREAGLSDENCIEMIRIARQRNQEFSDGSAIAGLIRAGMAQKSVLELARLDQLGLRAGEAQAMRLSRLSDNVILAIARRRAAGQASLSGAGATTLQNLGYSENAIIAEIAKGTTDSDAEAMMARRSAVNPGFVRQRGTRRR